MAGLIKFDNVLNVRDFGGHGVADYQVVQGRLFRGAQISTTSEKDRTQFSDYGISLVIDFRYRSERKRQPSRYDDIFAPDVFEVSETNDLDADDQLAPHEAFVLNELNTADDAMRYMLNSYAERPQNPAFTSVASRALKRMAQHGDAVYVHCAAGKDRTGTFVALLLMLLGVSDADIMEDYLRTRDALEFNLIKAMAAKKMESRYGRIYDPDSLAPFFGVYPEFLENSLVGIGNAENYAKTVLGLSGADIQGLRRHYYV